MPKMVGIHEFFNGELFIEIGNFKNKKEAYEAMERNDSGLTILTFKELEKIYQYAKDKDSSKMILIS